VPADSPQRRRPTHIGQVRHAGKFAAALLQTPTDWECFAAFPKAAYFHPRASGSRLGQVADSTYPDMVVLIDDQTTLGPLHFRVSGLLPLTISRGQRAHFDCDSQCEIWEGPMPTTGLDVRLSRQLLTELGNVEPLGTPELGVRVISALRVADLAALSRLLGGLGPGLTPAGDDILAGILLVSAAKGTLTEQTRIAISQVNTNRIAQDFLRAAAMGQCIAPSHDLLVALAAADARAARLAIEQLKELGASSGTSLAWGMLATAANKAPLSIQ
jgi:hypothetical protein